MYDHPYVYLPALNGELYEERFLEHIRGLGRRGVYIDAGAHLGTHSLWFALCCPARRVHAFEPVKRFADVIRRNIRANRLGRKIRVHEVGLGERVGEAANLLCAEHQIGFDPAPRSVRERFAVTTLDEAVRGRVAVIKIDVEGMEAPVLRGASRILARYQPVVFAEARTAGERDVIAGTLSPFHYEPTGRVFNASPTYEFAVPRGWPVTARPYRR